MKKPAAWDQWADEEEDRTEDGGSAKQILSLRDRLSSSLGTFVEMNDALAYSEASASETAKFDNPVAGFRIRSPTPYMMTFSMWVCPKANWEAMRTAIG